MKKILSFLFGVIISIGVFTGCSDEPDGLDFLVHTVEGSHADFFTCEDNHYADLGISMSGAGDMTFHGKIKTIGVGPIIEANDSVIKIDVKNVYENTGLPLFVSFQNLSPDRGYQITAIYPQKYSEKVVVYNFYLSGFDNYLGNYIYPKFINYQRIK